MKELRNFICKNTPRNKDGYMIFNLTIGKEYKGTWCDDPEGWLIYDDLGHKEVFFDTSIIFL